MVVGRFEYEKRGDKIVPKKATIKKKIQFGKYSTAIEILEYEIEAVPSQFLTKEAIGL